MLCFTRSEKSWKAILSAQERSVGKVSALILEADNKVQDSSMSLSTQSSQPLLSRKKREAISQTIQIE